MAKINLKNLKFSNLKINSFFCFDCTCSWIALIIFFSLLSLVVLGGSVFLYLKIDKGQAFISGVEVEGVNHFDRIRKNELIKVINYFDNKEENFSQLKEGDFTKIIDPSL